MRPLIILLACLNLVNCSNGKQSVHADNQCITIHDTLSNQIVYTYVDKMPEYKGGISALLINIAKSLNYPNSGHYQGIFKVELVIDPRGRVMAPRIKDKNQQELSLVEREVLRCLSETTDWVAGSCFGEFVAVKIYLPLRL
jgi:hypothetical protein